MSEELVIKLSKPLKTESGEVSELKLKSELTLEELEDMPVVGDRKLGDFYPIIAKACVPPQPVGIIKKISSKDMTEVMNVMGKLLGESLETGEASQET